MCSKNQWRSPTAEQIWRNHESWVTRSAGTSRNARCPVNADLIRWADVIFVMEQKHKNRLQADFSRLLEYKPLHILDIPDNYQYMNPELVQILQDTVPSYLS
ncbi:phosphotyrosine protein phosphatase [Providencia rettgeri]|nr:phosphotyrosine protein phosphatase [Providencia rettgeri]